ncbi:MAG: sn-glycerol-3-phosphate ABC transporter ATP-binding protein UgpC [Nitriliruptorales bacterium]|nr:sn-glycerol-3-phosphate ABC transporter ATP-binding protein UgpC [Nitriliruptorales bacterium]
MAELEFRDVTKEYDDGTVAVDNLNLQIKDGEFVVFVGPSGCGKTTSLRMAAGLEEITSGDVLIDAEVVNHLTPKERDIAMVFQNYALYPHMTVGENMGFALRLAHVDKPSIASRVKAAANTLGLGDLLKRKPRELSGGQRQRVAMGRAIVRNPKAFLMDEPLSNLDAKLRGQMRAEIARLQDELGTTTLYVTHDQVEAMTMGDRVAVMRLGQLQQYDVPDGLYSAPVNLFVASFIGSPPMNLCVAHVERRDDDHVVRCGSNELTLAPAALEKYPKLADYAGRDVAVGIRPESFFRSDPSPNGEQRFRADVNLVERLGAEALVHVSTDATPVVTEEIADVFEDTEAFEDLRKQQTSGMNMVCRADPRELPQRHEVIEVPVATGELHFFDLDTGHALR